MTGDNSKIRHDHYLDAKGLNCPLPVLKAKFALVKMNPGEILCVEATDPHAHIDFQAYCARSGHEVVQTLTQGDVITFYIKRGDNPLVT
jgi:tRNA 2-thiouridine synthesizing protein A